MATALIGLGGNLGDVLACFRRSVRAMEALPESELVRVSRAYRTRALMADPSQPRGPDYWNAAVMLDTALAPRLLLDELLTIERGAGRVRRARWEARPLDLDLLAVDEVVNFDTALTLPHPEISRRIFVLAPLAEIAPEWRIGARSAAQWLAEHDPSDLLEVRDGWWP